MVSFCGVHDTDHLGSARGRVSSTGLSKSVNETSLYFISSCSVM